MKKAKGGPFCLRAAARGALRGGFPGFEPAGGAKGARFPSGHFSIGPLSDGENDGRG